MTTPKSQKNEIKLVIGIGNPGKVYHNTYHNVGLLAIDWFAKNKTFGGEPGFKKAYKLFQYETASGVIWAKSLAFMNESGRAIAKAAKHFRIRNSNILIVHDDSDIEIGKFRLSFGRGSAGHKGIESTIKHLKTKNFWRLRIGIRPITRIRASLPAVTRRAKAGEFVLKKINYEDKDNILVALKEASVTISGIIASD